MKVTMKFNNSLSKLSKTINELSKSKSISFNDLYPRSFMLANSSFSSFEELISNSTFTITSQEDFNNIPEKEWDSYIKSVTKFSSWDEMKSKAFHVYMSKKLAS
ncbi:hypothetical protein [Aliarcobacter cryaerophilus]|uniref:hypothetical protein n=1 Tax=Aliarcobacter cryaerophilus TaxID=28198 RepID=UPI003DA5585B